MENAERRIKVPTTGVFDFPSLILGGKGKYVDKTDLLYQGGYLTIKETRPGDPETGTEECFVLAPPNLEVREALKRGYLAQVMGLKESYADKWIGGERPVTLVGINFNPKKRNIDMPIIEKV